MKKIRTTLNIEKVKQHQAIMRGIWQPSRLDWKEVIEDYLFISRKRYRNKWSMFLLQKDLLMHVDSEQKNIRMLKDILDNPENITNYNPDFVPDNPEDLKKETELQLEEANLRLRCIKDIADSHVWRMLKYNYGLLYYLGMQPSTGNLDQGPGFFNEVMQWGGSILNTNIKQFMLCDLTNYARIGDLIIVNEDESVEIQEIKLGKSQRGRNRRARLKRQEEKRKQFEELANTGETILEGMRYKILETSIPFETSLDSLEKLMLESQEVGISGSRIYPHLSIVCIDYSKVTDKNISEDDLIDTIDKYNKPQKEGDHILPFFSFQRSAYSPNFLPYSIYPISEELISDLMFGKISLYFSLNISELYRRFENEGWKVTKGIDDFAKGEVPDAFCHIHKSGLTIPVTWPLINNIIFETLKIENLIEMFNQMYILVEKNNDVLYFPNFLQDNAMWW